MADVQLDIGGDDWVTVSGAAVHVTAADLMLDNGDRRGGHPGHRRALVHDEGDALTLNFNGDYTGGLRLNDAVLRLHVEDQTGEQVRLPDTGVVGELRLVRLRRPGEVGALQGPVVSLWVCVGRPVLRSAPVSWVPLALGEAVLGGEE